MQKTLIGIDPDIDKSGVCVYRSKESFDLYNLKFFDLFKLLKRLKNDSIGHTIEVYIEAGWLNKSNWHSVKNGSAKINAKIGGYVGANHQVGKLIIEMCEYLGIEYKTPRPNKNTKKVTHEYFSKLTGITKRTNQEQRDAVMLVYGR